MVSGQEREREAIWKGAILMALHKLNSICSHGNHSARSLLTVLFRRPPLVSSGEDGDGGGIDSHN